MRFRLLSKNTMVIVEEILKNEDLVKLLYYKDGDPLSGEAIGYTGSLVNSKIHITPFAGKVPKTEDINLRVFFPKGRVKKRVVLGARVSFQIVTHNNLWKMRDKDGKQCLRPYEVMAELVETFEDKSIGTLGVINFVDFRYHHIEGQWGVYTLEAEVMAI